MEVTDALADYRSGSTEPWLVDVLCSLVRAKRASLVIETGTFEGRTTLALAEAMRTYRAEREGLLITVEADPTRASIADQRLINSAGTAGSVQIMVQDALAFLTTFTGKADLIFLDDDHSPQHVEAEVFAALKLLAPGGLICLHDVLGPFGLDRVVRGFGGVVLDFPRLHVAGGLGIIAP